MGFNSAFKGLNVFAVSLYLVRTTHSRAGNGLHLSEWPWCLWKRAGETLNVTEIFYGIQCSAEHTLGSASLSERFGNFTVLNKIFLYPSRLKFWF